MKGDDFFLLGIARILAGSGHFQALIQSVGWKIRR